MDRTTTLKGWGINLKEKQKQYAEFVEQGLIEETVDFKSKVIAQSILGCDSFVDRIRRQMVSITEGINDRRETGRNEKIISSLTFEALLNAVTEEYHIESSLLLTPNYRHEARQVLIYMAGNYCRGRYSLSELCCMLGPISLGGMSGGIYNFRKKRLRKKEVVKRIKSIKEKLNVK